MSNCANCGGEMEKTEGGLLCKSCGAKLVVQNKSITNTNENNGKTSLKDQIIVKLVVLRELWNNLLNDRATIASCNKNIATEKHNIEQKNKQIEEKELQKAKIRVVFDFYPDSDFLVGSIFILSILAGLAAGGYLLYALIADVIVFPMEEFFFKLLAAIASIIGGALGGFLGCMLVCLLLYNFIVNGFKLMQHLNILGFGMRMRAQRGNIDKDIGGIKNEIEKLDNKILDYQNKISKLDKIANNKYNCLVESFGNLIHPSDFPNVDYLLYLFITRRADTIKEALLLLDEQKRKEELQKCIISSTQYLQSNLSAAILDMKADIRNEFSHVNKKLDWSMDVLQIIDENQHYYR